MTIAISLVTMSPPAVDMGLAGLPAGTASVSVSRVWSGVTAALRTVATVAGATGHLIDYDVPVGRAVTYAVSAYSAAGALLESATSGTVTIAAPDGAWGWLSDPMAPRGALLVELIMPTDTQRTYAAPLRLSSRMGSGLPSVSSGPRVTQGWPVAWMTDTNADALIVEDLLAPGGVLMLRVGPDALQHRTGVVFLATATVDRSNLRPSARTVWSCEAVESRGPALPPVLVPWTLDDLKGQGGTLADLRDAWAGKTLLGLARG